ncbi:unnamed protein product [Ilex paraguariensis]|uniref:F-box domain-containing protein n=1 Tax=Ilex paraguariensis TaxID=185542 RepID=A0ABC8UNV1_9AQUA
MKYLVNLDPVMDAFPESILGLHYYKFLILNLLRRNDDNESFLVLGIPGKAIRYNIKDKTFKKLCDFPPGHLNFEPDHAPMSGSSGLKVSCDGAFKGENAAVGIIVSDINGKSQSTSVKLRAHQFIHKVLSFRRQPNTDTTKSATIMAAESIPSAHRVTGDDDLLTGILIRLPTKPLLRFKSVSKHWLSLITSPYFYRRRSQGITTPSGLFLRRYSSPKHDFIPLDGTSATKPHFRTLNIVERGGIQISQSCNGLLCCFTVQRTNAPCKYYICNPTTQKITTLPDPSGRIFNYTRGVQLAFDPSKSSCYKVVCVYSAVGLSGHYEIEVYSSETGIWSRSGNPFRSSVKFKQGVFWNGAINWFSSSDEFLCFNVDEELLRTLSMPPVPSGGERRFVKYFVESNDHLHLIENYGPPTSHVIVYEMPRDYSGWFVKYIVDLDAVMKAFPGSINEGVDPSDVNYYMFLILNLTRMDDDDESFLLFTLPGKAMRYNLSDRTFKIALDLDEGQSGIAPIVPWAVAFPYIETLACV